MILINLDHIREIVSNVKDPNQQQLDFGNTLLHVIVEFANSDQLVQKLINAGADVNATNFIGITPLHCAVIHRNHSAFNALIQSGALTNCKDFCGNTALHYSINNCMLPVPHPQCPDLVYNHHFPDKWLIKKLLLHKTSDVNAVNDRKETSLMWAVEFKEFDIVKALLKKSANVNIGDHFNKTPLHAALYDPEPNSEIVLELLLHGACINCLDNYSRTPADILIERLSSVHSGPFVEIFSKIMALMQEINGFSIPEKEVNSHVSPILKRCKDELQQMKNDVIEEKWSLFEFMCKNFNAKEFGNLKSDGKSKLVDILISGKYSIYCDIILKRIPKFELCRVITEFAFLRKHFTGSKKGNYLSLFSNLIITHCLSGYLLKTDMFNVIVALFIEKNTG